MPEASEAHLRFDELYRSLASPILAYAARRTASPQDAADVMAETFAVVWRRIDDVPDGDEARPWLYGVARGVLANHHRGARRRLRLSDRVAAQLADAVSASQVESAPEPSGRTADDPAVVAALAALDDADRELLMLLAWDDLTRAEVARVLDCTTATLRVRLHRARARFRAALDAQAIREIHETDETEVGTSGPSVDVRTADTAPSHPGVSTGSRELP